ncbi:hypothetical protein BH11BAC3_BH11BAC3_03820 [soil metagenome]
MFAKMCSPVTLSGSELDNYLASGWFRMRQNIFTTSFLQFNEKFYSVIWLRVALMDLGISKKQKLLYKTNAAFTTEIKKVDLTDNHEMLYQAYRQYVSFEISATLQELLTGNDSINRFDTYEVNVYDGSKLIAAGFFDLGKNSAAGISCIYHPDYKKHSLGKYLMFLKMDFCRLQQKEYFYPGYLVPGYKAFDYKLEIGKDQLQYFNLASGQWLPYKNFDEATNPLIAMIAKLQKLKIYLEEKDIVSSFLYYKFFDVNLDPGFHGNELFDFPVFLYCFPTMGSFDYHIIVYDVRDHCYRFLKCSSVILLDYYTGKEHIFNSGLLKTDRVVAVSANPAEIAMALSSYL